jgi:TolA-binding protein
MKPKGMHDIPTAQSLVSRSIPASRAKIMTQLARMEQERERLERESNVWGGKQQQTEDRLQQVRQRIELLQRALDELPADEERKDSGTRRMAGEERKAKGWREIPLEY